MDIFAIAGFGTNFMFSLGIIFVVIFIVFYIRQRLTNVDHKINSMFQLINAMADEMNTIKSKSISDEDQIKHVNGVCLNDPMNMMSMLDPKNSQLIEVSDDDSCSDDSDDESDDDSDDESDCGRPVEIMIDNVENSLVFDEITKVSDVIEVCEVMRPIVIEQVEEVEEVEGWQDIVVEQVVEEAVEVEDSKTIVNLQLLNFKKMTIKDLREHIIHNQLTDIDISKLKKNELLKLCE
tara:strand:+ start:3377 stop:4084 length:708 start_codon:yes stop_codon:yes gene_type:complete